MRRDCLAVDSPRLFRVELDKRCGIDDLVQRFGERLTLLGRQDAGDVVLMLEDQFVPALEDRRAVFREPLRPRLERAGCGVIGSTGVPIQAPLTKHWDRKSDLSRRDSIMKLPQSDRIRFDSGH
jgi:hypothetical protein